MLYWVFLALIRQKKNSTTKNNPIFLSYNGRCSPLLSLFDNHVLSFVFRCKNSIAKKSRPQRKKYFFLYGSDRMTRLIICCFLYFLVLLLKNSIYLSLPYRVACPNFGHPALTVIYSNIIQLMKFFCNNCERTVSFKIVSALKKKVFSQLILQNLYIA